MRKWIVWVLIISVFGTITGCDKSHMAEDEDRNSRTDVEAEPQVSLSEILLSQSVSSAEALPEKTPADESMEAYQKLLQGENVLYVDKWDLDQLYISFDEENYFETDTPYELQYVFNYLVEKYYTGSIESELKNVSYSFIDCGADGIPELALLFSELQSHNCDCDITIIIKYIDEKLQVCYAGISEYRGIFELSNEYGVCTFGGSNSAISSGDVKGFINENGDYILLYSEETKFVEVGWPEDVALSEATKKISYEGDLVLLTYHFTEYSPEMDIEEYQSQAVRSFEVYNVIDETTGAEIPVLNEDYIYQKSVYKDIIDEAGVDFYSKQEIEQIIQQRISDVGFTQKIDNGQPVTWTALEESDFNSIYHIAKENGKSENERAIEAYRRFLSVRSNLKQVLSMTIGDGLAVCSGMITGFYLKDLDDDTVPELLICLSTPEWWGSQITVVYKFDSETGKIYLDKKMPSLSYVDLDHDYLPEYVEYKRNFDAQLTAAFPEYANSLLYNDELIQLMGYNDAGQLVWFNHGSDMDRSITLCWCTYEEYDSNIYSYMEDATIADNDEQTPIYVVEGSRELAEKALIGYKPILFYPITEDNINKYVVADYLNTGIEDYTENNVINQLRSMEQTYESIDKEYLYSDGTLPDESGYGIGYNLEYLLQTNPW